MFSVDLTAVVPEAYMKRFLIYAESNSECGYGRLRSLSGESERRVRTKDSAITHGANHDGLEEDESVVLKSAQLVDHGCYACVPLTDGPRLACYACDINIFAGWLVGGTKT